MSEIQPGQNETSEKQDHRKGFPPIPLVIGITLVGFGVLLLLGQIFEFQIGRYIWPFFILVPGAVLLYIADQSKDQAAEVFLILGSIFSMIGLIFLYQTITNHWVSWSYAWALIAPTSFGIGFWWYGQRHNRSDLIKTGQDLTKIGLIIFLVAAAFFEIILGLSRYGRIFTPVLIIIAGGYLLYQSIKK